jgi:hypothetical protein
MIFLTKTKQSAYTIVEFIIAMSLGLVFLLGVATVMNNSHSVQRTIQQSSKIGEKANFALGLLEEAIQYSGYQYCLLPREVGDREKIKGIGGSEVSMPAAPLLLEQRFGLGHAVDVFSTMSLRGYRSTDSGFSPTLPAADTSTLFNQLRNLGTGTSGLTIKPNSDLLLVAYADPFLEVKVSAGMASTASAISLNSSLDARYSALATNNTYWFITDCVKGEVFRPTGYTPAAGTAAASLSHGGLKDTYAEGSDIAPVYVDAFFVAKRSNEPYHLYRLRNGRDNLTNVQPIVSGVEHLAVLYGEMIYTGSTANIRFLSATEPSINFKNINTIKVGVLIRDDQTNSVDAVNLPEKYYVLNDEVIPTVRAKIHKSYEMTYDLKNRN